MVDLQPGKRRDGAALIVHVASTSRRLGLSAKGGGAATPGLR